MKQKTNRKRGGNYDNCSTPGYAVDPIEDFIPLTDVIWEPAYGEGYLANVLKKRGYNVWVSSIESGQDFFVYTPGRNFTIVTNPPFSLKYEWIERCYDLGMPWFLLLPVETIGAGRAQKMFSKYGVNVIWMSKRINFKMPYKGWQGKGSQFPTAWFWWRQDITGRMDFYSYDYLTREVRESYEY